MSLMITAVTRPHRLQWWQWGQVFGVVLPVLFLTLGIRDPLFWAVAVHLFADFTAQSDETAAGKRSGDRRIIAYHAFVSGGFPGLIVGGLPGLIFSAVIHYFIDTTNKFRVVGPMGPVLDQGAHILTILVIWAVFL